MGRLVCQSALQPTTSRRGSTIHASATAIPAVDGSTHQRGQEDRRRCRPGRPTPPGRRGRHDQRSSTSTRHFRPTPRHAQGNTTVPRNRVHRAHRMAEARLSTRPHSAVDEASVADGDTRPPRSRGRGLVRRGSLPSIRAQNRRRDERQIHMHEVASKLARIHQNRRNYQRSERQAG